MQDNPLSSQSLTSYRPTTAYVGATWAVLTVGSISFFVGLWNATGMTLSEKGFYGVVLALGLYASISLQKTIRDQSEGIPTSMLYYWISWIALSTSIILIIIGLFNAAGLSLSEKGFYLMSFTLSMFAAITIQKNTRDEAQLNALQSGVNTPILAHPINEINESNESSEKSLFGTIRSKSKSEPL